MDHRCLVDLISRRPRYEDRHPSAAIFVEKATQVLLTDGRRGHSDMKSDNIEVDIQHLVVHAEAKNICRE